MVNYKLYKKGDIGPEKIVNTAVNNIIKENYNLWKLDIFIGRKWLPLKNKTS